MPLSAIRDSTLLSADTKSAWLHYGLALAICFAATALELAYAAAALLTFVIISGYRRRFAAERARLLAEIRCRESLAQKLRNTIVSLEQETLERRRTEQSLRQTVASLQQSEARFNALLSATSQVLYRMSPDWDTLLQMQDGKFLSEIPLPNSDWLSCYIHPDDQEFVLGKVRSAVQAGMPFELEHRVKRVDGELGWTYSRAVPVRDADGNITEWFGVATDITERKRVEAALHESEEKFRCAMASAAIGMAIASSNHGPASLDLNDAYCRMLGYSHDELRNLPRHALIHPDDYPTDERLLKELYEGCIPSVVVESRYLRKDGSETWVRKSVSLVRDARGEPRWTIVLAEDITAQKAAEAQLQAARAEAVRANHAKSRFLAAASHDLRQPLSAVSIYANALVSHVDVGGKGLLHNLKSCTRNLSELLNDLLDLSKLEAGVVKPKLRDFDLADILVPLISAHGPEARLKELQLRCLPSAVTVRTDPVLLKRIVGNFITNAIRYTEHGGVLIGCRRRDGKRWLEVWDTGIGIPDSKRQEVFEEFRQLDESRTRGSGLGLTIVARAAALLGLQVRMQSRVGQGSLFAVELPPGQQPAFEAPMRTPPIRRRPLRIALAEDNQTVREALAAGLRNAGHQVYAAASGRELKAALASEIPDLVVSDYRLKGRETGVSVINNLRKAHGSDVPGFLITGDTDPVLLRKLKRSGIAVLYKPFDWETLIQQIDTSVALTERPASP